MVTKKVLAKTKNTVDFKSSGIVTVEFKRRMYKPEENKIVITLDGFKSLKKRLLEIKKVLLGFDNVKKFLDVISEDNKLIIANHERKMSVILMKMDGIRVAKIIKSLGFTVTKII